MRKNNLLSLLIPMLAMGVCYATEPGAGNKKDVTILDFDEMMDMTMDKVETLPDFVNPPAGSYLLTATEAKIEKYEQKAKEGRPAGQATRIKIYYKVDKTLETADMPVRDGSLFSESFMGTSEGVAYFKRQAMNILNVSELGDATMKDVIVGLKDQQFKAKITIRKSPNPAGGEYENVQIRPVHDAAPAA